MRDEMKMNKNKRVEMLKAINKLDSYGKSFRIPPEKILPLRGDLAAKISKDPTAIEKRLNGLRKEDEFHLISLILGNVEQITKLEQKDELENDFQIPDFLAAVKVPKQISARENMLQRFFVEVKKNPDGQFEFFVSKSYYKKLRMYCDVYTLPLYFAVKMNSDKHNFSQWFLIPGKAIEEKSKVEKRKIHGSKFDDCYVLAFNDLIQNNFFSLWMNNHLVYLLEGFTITKTYNPNGQGSIYEPRLGKLEKIECSFKDKKKNLIYSKKTEPRDILFFVVLKKMATGKETKTKESGRTKITYTTDGNYIKNFYHIVLSAYLDFRERMKPVLSESFETDITYFLDEFNKFDLSVVNLIKDIIFEMENIGLVMPVKDLPKELFDKITTEYNEK